MSDTPSFERSDKRPRPRQDGARSRLKESRRPPSLHVHRPQIPSEGGNGEADINDSALQTGTLRTTGFDVIDAVAWGSHFCQFYQTREDLLDILVPYFRVGLENNEFCMWISSQPLRAEEARAALAAVVPDLEQRVTAGQIEILDYHQWYIRDGKFNAERVLQGWVDKLTIALHRGFEGLRLTGNTFWLEKSLWKDFSDYEAAIDRVIGQYRMIALCTYSLEKCGVFEVMDVVRNHQFTLIRQEGKWEILQSMQRKVAEQALRESEQRYRNLFTTMSEGFALHEILCDGEGRPCDYRFLEVNPAFEKQTGLSAGALIGRTVREVLPQIEPLWIERYGRVALTGQPGHFEAWSAPLGRWYDVRAYQTVPGRCAVVFTDITERKRAENELHDAHKRLQAQAEELRVSNEELRAREVALRESEERFRATYEQAAIGIEMLGLDGHLLGGNGALCRILGYDQQELQGRCFRDITHPEDLRRELPLLEDLLAARLSHYTIEKRYLHKNGHAVWVRVTSSLAHLAKPYRISIIEDITERKRAEEELLRVNRVLRALSNSSQALMRAAEEAAYLQEVCRIVVEDCGHAMVWIGYAEQDEAKSVRPVAYAGFEEGYLETLRITWADTERGRGPTGTALRTGQPSLCRNMLTDPDFAPWREEALKRGYGSSIVLPLLSDGKAFGAVTIYSREPDPFTADEVKLLLELAADLSYGITSLRLRAAHAQAEEAVRESEKRLRLALEGGGMGRWEWDVRSDSAFWDQRVNELLGLVEGVAASRDLFFRTLDRRDRDAVRQLVEKSLASGEDFRAEFRVRRPKGGETAWLISRGKVVRDERNQAVRIMGVMYDITQRKQMEADLRRLNDQLEEEVQAQTEELKDTIDRLEDEVVRRVLAEGKLRKRSRMLEAFFQHTLTPLAFLDRRFNFVRVNEAYARADGKVPDYFVGKNHFALYPDPDNQAIFEQVVRNKQPYRAYAKPFIYPDDPQRVTYWNWLLTPLLDDHGQVQFLVLNLQDVTERQKAFQELEQRAQQLQKLTLELSQAEDRERKRLAEILHDDLQQQLAAAKFHLGILNGRVKKDKALREITDRLNDILKDAIDKSRSLSHELSPAVLYQSDLGETFEWLARQVRTKHGLTVHLEVRGRIDSPSEALKIFLYKAAQEILFNVIKHAQVKEATLRLQRVRGQLWLTISDKGRGFDARRLPSAGGFGLLSIRERIELLGGRMRIRSIQGRGSTFLIAVPDGRMPENTPGGRESVSLECAAHAGGRKGPAGDRRLRVLLADDHEVMREGLAALLNEQQDLEIVGQAGNGREAVDLAYQLRPDVVVMDASMPVMAGDEATRQIKLHLPDTRVVALSMFNEVEMADRMRRAGAEIYLLKTAPSEELLAAIRTRL